jgi:peptide subunit release factor 1 (eRF1)
VDLLVLSPAFLFTEADEAESSVHAALQQGARVEVLSGEAAEQLDRAAGGIAGKLRFALDPEPPPAA